MQQTKTTKAGERTPEEMEELARQVRLEIPPDWSATRAFDAFSNAPEFISVSRPCGYYKAIPKEQRGGALIVTRSQAATIGERLKKQFPSCRVVVDSDTVNIHPGVRI